MISLTKSAIIFLAEEIAGIDHVVQAYAEQRMAWLQDASATASPIEKMECVALAESLEERASILLLRQNFLEGILTGK